MIGAKTVAGGTRARAPVVCRRLLSATPATHTPLYLNPHAWKGLPADRIFELHELRKTALGDKYVPNDDERQAILSTVTELGRKTSPELEYVYALDHFKERHMNNTPASLRGRPPQKTGIEVIKQGETPHRARKREILNNVSAFEMPLLAKYRQTYAPRAAAEAPLVLKFADDFSNEATAFNRRVTLACQLEDLGLDDMQARKLKILAGARFDHFTNVLRIASASYPEPAQNAKWLVETFGRLLAEARDTAKDDFADIPLDTRSTRAQLAIQKVRPRFEYPEHWKRPEDSPVEKFKIVRKLVDTVKQKKDEAYIREFSP